MPEAASGQFSALGNVWGFERRSTHVFTQKKLPLLGAGVDARIAVLSLNVFPEFV